MTLLKTNRSFTLLFLSQLIAQLGNKIYLIALSWYFVAVMKDATALATLFLVASLPSFFIGLLVGPLIERWNKQRTVGFCQFLSGCLTFSLVLMLHNGVESKMGIYAVAFFLNALNIFISPSINSMIPGVVKTEELQEGMSFIRMITSLGQFMGAALGGVLLGILDVELTILVNALSFWIASTLVLFIRYTPYEQSVKTGHMKQIAEGLRYVGSDRTILSMVFTSSALNIFIPSLLVFIPIVIKEKMGLGAWQYGLAEAMIPVGAVLSALYIARKSGVNHVRWFAASMLLFPAVYLIVGGIQWLPVMLFAFFVYGCALNLVNANAMSYFAKTVPAAYRGRFFTLMEAVVFAMFPLSFLMSSAMLSHLDVNTILIIHALCIAVIATIAFVDSFRKTNT